MSRVAFFRRSREAPPRDGATATDDGPLADPVPAATRDDEHLLRAAEGGDLDAFNLLVLRHQGAVFNVCLRLLRDVAAAEDATQDAFVRAWTGAHSFRGGSVRAWLFKIATNRAYDLLRVRARRPVAALDADALDLEPIWPGQAEESPEERALRDDLGIRLERALSTLPEDQRTAVLLADVQGCSYEEVAAATGAALGTVKSRLSRARSRLRQALTDDPTAAELFDRFGRLHGERRDRTATPAPAGAASPPSLVREHSMAEKADMAEMEDKADRAETAPAPRATPDG